MNMNRKARRTATEKAKNELVMFAITAPPLGQKWTVVKTTLEAFDAMKWGGLDDKTLDHQILSIDKDIIRAIYYPDEIASIKGTQEMFTCALAESVKRWSQGLTAVQQPYFNYSGTHELEITEVEDRVEWFWTLNTNNKMQLRTNTARLTPVANLDMRNGSTASAPIDIGIADVEIAGGATLN
jgi:hypothetical protein